MPITAPAKRRLPNKFKQFSVLRPQTGRWTRSVRLGEFRHCFKIVKKETRLTTRDSKELLLARLATKRPLLVYISPGFYLKAAL
ncbi:hypothetical protein chiPu_0004105 [Chiloscyllium punctatum]|uniref:Uncharacterized protein n=1 Tax=Chiloscyllium punctatum TaxID=137246 RepID=A0A401S5M1_CHIPU|nr:hypothetical protein [Chiloscyllium punctatum]